MSVYIRYENLDATRDTRCARRPTSLMRRKMKCTTMLAFFEISSGNSQYLNRSQGDRYDRQFVILFGPNKLVPRRPYACLGFASATHSPLRTTFYGLNNTKTDTSCLSAVTKLGYSNPTTLARHIYIASLPLLSLQKIPIIGSVFPKIQILRSEVT